MGYEDPSPLADRITVAISDVRRILTGNYGSIPEEARNQFISYLARLTTEIEGFNEELQSYSSATEYADSGPSLPPGETVFDWYAVAGMPVWKIYKSVRGGRSGYTFRESASPAPAEAEIVIYLDKYNEIQLEAVQAAAVKLGYELGYTDFVQTDEQIGSIFRRLLGKFRTGLASDYVQQKLEELDTRASLEISGRAQAETTSITAASAATLIASLADIPNAVVRVGAILVVKQTDASGVPAAMIRQLSMREIRALELNPGIQKDPRGVLQLLAAAVAQLEEDERRADPPEADR